LYEENIIALDRAVSNDLFYAKLVRLEVESSDVELDVQISMLEDILDSTLPGGIATPLRFDEFIAQSLDFDLYRHRNTHLEMRFWARADAGVSLDDVQSAFEAALMASASNGIPIETFEKIKKRHIDSIESTDDIPKYTKWTVTSQVSNRQDPFGYSDVLKTAMAVTLEDVNSLYAALIGDGRTIIRRVTPKP